MTRAKNKKDLTPEEKRAQALVPPEEQPYKVPGNWRWVRAKLGFNITSSKRVHKEDWKSEGIPFYRTRELVKLSENGYVDNELFITQELYEEFKNQFGVPKVDDLLISGVGTIGIPYIVSNDEPFYFKDGNVIWFQNKGVFLSRYIYFLYKSTFMQNQLHEMSAGTTVETYTIINAEKTAFPLPPLSEQRRIVDRIERLFARLDEAACKAQSVLASCEARKSAILHKAFTGELTENWRKVRNIPKSSWACLHLEDVAQWGSGGTPSRKNPEYFTGVIPWVKTGELNDSIIYNTEERITQNAITHSSAKLFPANSVLIAMYGATIGKTAILGIPATTNQACACAVTKTNTNYKFLFYYLRSQKNVFIQKSKGGAQPNISQEIIKGHSIDLPSLQEQFEIVRLLENIVSEEDALHTITAQTISTIDALKKSILARAFRGELGTNDPAEPAAELPV